MNKKIKNNKKGFTLVEIIVVLLIIGILLAITIPSIMGYVGKAKDASIEAEARSGYVAAQTITARVVANKQQATNDDVKATEIAKELNETTPTTITASGCTFTADKKNIDACAFRTKSSGTDKVVVFRTNPGANQDPTEVVKESGNTVTITPAEGSAKPAVTITLQ